MAADHARRAFQPASVLARQTSTRWLHAMLPILCLGALLLSASVLHAETDARPTLEPQDSPAVTDATAESDTLSEESSEDSTESSSEPVFSHQLWQQVLDRFVDEKGFVDYAGLAADRDDLDRYLESIRTQGPKNTPKLFPSRDHELAFYMNAYNALVFDGVLGLGPDVKTVWGWTGSGFSFFVMHSITVDGERTNLKKLEDDIIRARYQDPRIHAAINCASISCPRLPQEAFLAETLDAQLEAAMLEFVSAKPSFERLPEARTVLVSKIFDWFRGDFLDYENSQGVSNPSLQGYLNRYLPEDEQIPADWEIKVAKYDKGLNRQ
ncbi:MAG: DUF547 domain-containing protein [Acidobacteriota bacterium]